LTYQRKVGKRLKKVFSDVHEEQWFKFEDFNGLGYAQPDFFILSDRVLVFEAKLSQTIEGYQQLTNLYFPLLEEFYNLSPVGIQVCRNLIDPDITPLISHPCEIGNESLYTWHFLG
jgi:hypothetical protein